MYFEDFVLETVAFLSKVCQTDILVCCDVFSVLGNVKIDFLYLSFCISQNQALRILLITASIGKESFVCSTDLNLVVWPMQTFLACIV